MNQKLKLTLKSITHSGSHIGRDITLKVSSLELGIDFETKKNVLPDKATVLNIELHTFEVKTSKLDMPLTVTVIERDALFNDTGSMYKRLYINTNTSTISEHIVTVKVYENRFFFWKKPAKFDVVFEVEVTPIKRIPTVDDPEWTGDYNDDPDDILFARLIFGEAENQPRNTKIGVGFTVINRVKKQRSHWGTILREIILKENQYDALWNINRRDNVRNPLQNATKPTMDAWKESYKIASGILDGSFDDPTDGATHFHSFTERQKGLWPNWTVEENFKNKLGDIYFYELER